MKNKTILIFTDYFLPGCKAGGPVTSISNLINLLEKEFNFIIVTRNKDIGMEGVYDNVEFDKLTKYLNFNIVYLSKINSKKINTIIKEINPDLIYLNSLFSSFTRHVLLLNLFSKVSNNIILAPRGEIQENALKIKKLKKKIYLTLFKVFSLHKKVYYHSTDITETNRIKKLFSINDITTISNVPRITDNKFLTKKENELKLIFLSRIRDNKNLHYALNVLKNTNKNITFDIYGPIEDKEYWEKCKQIISNLPENIKITYKGVLSPIDILDTMKKYHALLLPTKTENFGHVIVEAMLTGLIPIISDQTPWKDLEKNKIGWDINLNKEKEFLKAIEYLYNMNKNEYENYSKNSIRYIKEKLQIESLKNNYINMFKTQIKKEKQNNVQR